MAVSLGCGKTSPGGAAHKEGAKKTIRVEGSDTMVNVANGWREQYRKTHSDVSVQVLGPGSGVGIASLIDGNCDMATSSRKMEKKEIERAIAKRGGRPQQYIVGRDALAVYVHKDNPLRSISIDELAEIYGENGKITKWSQLGVTDPKLAPKKIIRVSRQNSSGTYKYFREAVLGPGRDYELGSIDQSGSKDVVALVARTPAAIGYSGMGYATPKVKMLKVSKNRGASGVAPTVENAKNESYPITRPLLVYVIGKPSGAVKDYLDWILSPAGQKVVVETGYVPVEPHE
jgi:phosphate transport system substrate-binding protein